MNTSIAILAAGLGTRMRSKRAKVLHRAGGLALVEHVVRAAAALAPADRIVVVTGHQAENVETVLAGYRVSFARQPDQKGTGHALLCCRERLAAFGGSLVVLYGDVPLLSPDTIARLRDDQVHSGAAATVLTTILKDPTGYGRVLLDSAGDVHAIVEHKNCTPEQLAVRVINSGIYCFRSDLLWEHLGEIKPNSPSGEYYLTDMPEILARHGHRMRAMHVEDSRELLGINTQVELADADRVLRERKCRDLMLSGVTIERPETVCIDADVRVGADTMIESHVRLLGATVIGDDCRVGAGAILDSAVLDDRSTVHPYSQITGSHIATGAEVGPFARLRPGTEVGANAQVGNFAELKNTKLGAGAKSHHVSYLGDSEIGENANIGAGTVVCNYDGFQKHQSRIGRAAFVGSNSTLVAPADIGDESYIAAGSVITGGVPAESLALGRARQVVKPGWSRKRKESRRR